MNLNRCSILAVTALLALSLCACGSGGDTEGQEETQQTETVQEETQQQTETTAATMTDDFSQGTKLWECDGLSFEVPISWEHKTTSGGSCAYFYPPTGSGINFLMVDLTATTGSVQTQEVFDGFVSGLEEASTDYSLIMQQLVKNDNGLVAGGLTFTSTVQGYPVCSTGAVFDSDSGITYFAMVAQQQWDYDYSNDVIKILNSVTLNSSTQQQDTPSADMPTATVGQINALEKALSYLDYMSFSASGLANQLEYEGFSQDEIDYAVENCGADWKEQAAKKAQSYMDYMSFSRSGLIDQLLFEGFTQEQAEYGAAAVGY